MQSANNNNEEMQHVVISVPSGIAEKAPTAPPTTDNQQPQPQQPRWSLARRLIIGGAIAAISVGAVHMVFEGQRRRNHHRMMELGLEGEDGNDIGPSYRRGGDVISERGGKYSSSQDRPERNDDDRMPHRGGKHGHRGKGRPQRDGENRPEGRPQRDGENRPEGRPQRDGEDKPEGRPQRGPKHSDQKPSVVSPVLAAPKQRVAATPKVVKAAV